MNTNPEQETQVINEAEQPTVLQRNLSTYFHAFGCSPALAPAMQELIQQMFPTPEEQATRAALYHALDQHEALRKEGKDISIAQLDDCHASYKRAMKTLEARREDVWARYRERFQLDSQPRLRAVALFASPHAPFLLFRSWMMGFEFPSSPTELIEDASGTAQRLYQKLHTSPEFFELRRRRWCENGSREI